MKVHVLYVVNGTTHNDIYQCTNASRQLGVGGLANIVFEPGPGVDEKGRRVRTVQYREAAVITTYEEDQ